MADLSFPVAPPGLVLAEAPEPRFLDAFVIDVNGNCLGKRLPGDQAAALAQTGVQFSASTLVLDCRGVAQLPLGIGGADGDPDARGLPVPGTLRPVPWAASPTVQCLLEMQDARSGAPLWFDPRAILRQVVERCRADGLHPVVACELEFYLLDRKRDGEGRIRPPAMPRTGAAQRRPANLCVHNLEEYEFFLRAVQDACAAQGISAGAMVSEYGLGQFEINLRHSADPLAAADEAALLRRTVRGVARGLGYEASFMAKPYVGDTGNGFHVHLSLGDEAGANRFGAAGGEDLLRSAIAGMQRLHAESMAIFAPNFSAYRRYVPGSFVPMASDWAENNRSVAFRVPASSGAGRRVEHRIACADASPHLLLAAILAAAHHGITQGLSPTPERVGAAGDEPDPAIPRDLVTALAALEQAAILSDYIPPRFLALYAALKRGELADLLAEISPREYDFYL